MSDTLLQTDSLPDHESGVSLIGRLRGLYETSKANKQGRHGEWERNSKIIFDQINNISAEGPGIRANECYSAITSRIGWMTDQEISCEITPAANPWNLWGYMVATIQATHLEDLINSIYYADHWYLQIIRMLWDEAIYGIGFLKVGWDSGALPGHGPTGEPIGQVTCKATTPWSLYVDPFADDLDSARWICQVHTMTQEEMERRFPALSSDRIADTAQNSDRSQTHVPPAIRGMGNKDERWLLPVNKQTGTMTTFGGQGGAQIHRPFSVAAQNVYEMWWKENYYEDVKPTDPQDPNKTEPVVSDRWRVTCWSGETVLLDEFAYDLFGQDSHPFVRYCSTNAQGFYGIPLMRMLGPIQTAMNRLLAMAQNNIEFTGNPVLIRTKGSGMDRSTMQMAPGQIYDVNSTPGGGTGNRPDWMQPPNLPPTLMNLVQFDREEIGRICGLEGPQRGSTTPQRSSKTAVQSSQEAGFIRIRAAQRCLEVTLSELFSKAAQIVMINYDVPRTVAIVGPQGEATALQLTARHFLSTNKAGTAPLRFSLLVNAGGSKPTSHSARIQEALQLKQAGCADILYVLEAARVKNSPQVYARIQEEQQAEAKALQQAKSEKGQTHEK